MTEQRTTGRRDFWVKGPGLVVLIVVVGLLAYGAHLFANRSGPADERARITVRSCEVGGGNATQTAKVGLTLRNDGDSATRFTATVEYRDAAGNALGTSAVKFPLAGAGDTVVASASKFLGTKVQSGTCVVTGVSD
jgi:hypothetical protein